MKFRHPILAVLAVLLLGTVARCAPSDNADSETPVSGLGVRQQHVQRLMQQLEAKFLTLAQTLAKTEPERAARLQKALVESKQLSLEQRMTAIAKLLDGTHLDKATDEQKKVLKDLEHLAEVLLGEDVRDEKLAEIERLERWRDQIQGLIDNERNHVHDADQLANKDRAISDVQRQIEAVEKLIDKQKTLIRDTQDSREKGIDGLHGMADRQHELRQRTEKLAQQISGHEAPPGKSAGDGQPQQGGQGRGQSGGEKGGQQAGGQSGQPGGQAGGEKGGQQAGEQGGKQSGQPGGQQGGTPENKHGEPPRDPNDAKQPGVKPLDDASKHQHDAEKNLDNGRGKAGQQDQEGALTKLQEALEALKQEKSRIASLPPEALDRLADRQGDTAEKTRQVGDDIAKNGQQGGQPAGEQGGQQGGQKDGKQGGQPGGQQGGEQGGQPGGEQGGEQGGQKGGEQGGKQGGQKENQQPAQQPLKNAQGQMQQAEKKLGEHQPAEAVPPAADAVKELKKALKEIEDRLAQLREEERLERLAKLEARFREMLARQKVATAATTEVQKHRDAAATLRRSDIIILSKLSDEERALGEMADQALEIIRDDGTSVVFPRIVDRLQGDLKRVAGWLEQKETGRRTQVSQQEIERTLEELIVALEEAQKKSKPGKAGDPSQAGQQDQDEPLMPDTAELKLLRAAQQRVNRLTAEFDDRKVSKPQEAGDREEVRRIAQQQDDIAVMTEEMIERK